MKNVEATVMGLRGLHDIGVSITVVKFGTGHSSLAYLKRFSMDKLKIYESFVSDAKDDAAIAQISINLVKQLNLGVIAVGGETVQRFVFLRENGCDVVQGYHFNPLIDAMSFID